MTVSAYSPVGNGGISITSAATIKVYRNGLAPESEQPLEQCDECFHQVVSMSISIVTILLASTFFMAVMSALAKPRELTPVPSMPSLCDMSVSELEALIAVHFERERELRAAQQIEAACEVGVRRFMCISELRSRH